jgi:hypothetical protein
MEEMRDEKKKKECIVKDDGFDSRRKKEGMMCGQRFPGWLISQAWFSNNFGATRIHRQPAAST